MRAKFSSWLRVKWPLLLPLLLLLPGMGGFPYPSPEAAFSDIAVSHFPNAVYLKRALLEYHTIPLWSPTILSGYPFAANPLSGLWYPPGWLALLFPLPLGFNLLVLLHLLWGGVGMTAFLRRQGLSEKAALLGGLTFELMPKLFAHYGAGHLTLLYAIPWTPWLLLAAQANREGSKKWYTQPGLLLAVIFLADVRWAAYAGLLWLATEIAHSHTDIKEKAKHIFWQLLLAFFLSAPLALPLLEYTSLSTRSHMTVTDILAFSLPPARLFGLVFPDFGGFHEFMLYPGILILCLASIALLVPASRQKGKIWFWVLLASLLYSLGENLPGVAELAQLPGFSLLRVPPRALFLAGISLVVLAAYGFESLLDGLEEVEKRRSRLLLVGLTAFGLALLVGVWAVTGTFPLNFAWGAGMLLLVWLWLEMNFWRRILPRFWVIGLFVLLIIDLGVVDRSLFALRSAEIVLSEGAEVAQWLSEQAGRFRVYSPSYSIPQQTAALYGLEMASGVDPLQLESYAEYMEEATGVFRTSYSITLPPMVGLDIATANQAIVPDCMFLARLNVKYVVSSFEIQGDGWTPIEIIGGDYIYQLSAMPRACLYQLPSDEIAVSQVKWSPNHIYVSVDGPGRLILSEINYPGWQAFVDGEKTQSEELDYLFRAVQLPEGQHTIEWVFRPTSVYLGLSLFLVGVVGLVLWGRRDH